MTRTLAEIQRTPVLALTEEEIAMLDADGQQYARRCRAQHARETACPGHEPISMATTLDERRGYHPARCRHCGMDMSRDSGG